MYVVQDNGGDLNTALWDGAAFNVHAEHDSSTENVQSMNFDFVFETHPARIGQGWLVWGTSTGADQIQPRRWNGAGWDALSPKVGDDTSFIRMAAHPSSGAIFAGTYERQGSGGADDIFEMHQTGGSGTWTALVSVWPGPTIADPVHQRIDIAPERRTPVIAWREVFP